MYTVIPSANGYFMLPAEAATYLKLAGAAQLKALIALYKNMGSPMDAAEIAKMTGLSAEDVEDALVFWAEKGLLAKTDAMPAVTVMRESPKQPSATSEPPSAAEQTAVPEKSEKKKIPLIKPTTVQINSRCKESPEIRELFLQAQSILGRTIGYDTQAQLLLCCDYLGLPVSVVLMICEYARSLGKSGISYITRTAESWAEEGINTLEAANKKIAALEETMRVWKEFAAHVGVTTPAPSKTQGELLYKWTSVFGYDIEVIYLAYDEMADHITKFSMAYMDKAITTWHEAGLKTPLQIKQYLAQHKNQLAEKAAAAAGKPVARAKPEGKNTASYDINAAEQRAAMGAPVYERKKRK